MKLFLKFARQVLTALALILAVNALPLRAEIIYWPLTALELAKQRGISIYCLRNLQLIALGARVWSSDHGDQIPPGFQVFTNEVESPAPFTCPANLAHTVSTNWAGFDFSQSDYEWIPQANWLNPADMISRCRIHELAALVNGAVEWNFGHRSGWPAIVAGTLAQEATPGSEVRFEAGIAPDALFPVSYQWRRQQLFFVTNVTFTVDPENPDGGLWRTNRRANFTTTILPGATNASFVIANAQTNHSDYYSVVVSNALGATASSPSRLSVDPSVAAKATNNHWS